MKLIDKKIGLNYQTKILGRVKRLENANDKYIKIIKKTFLKILIKRSKIVIDCANGAGYKSDHLLKSLGAKVFHWGQAQW